MVFKLPSHIRQHLEKSDTNLVNIIAAFATPNAVTALKSRDKFKRR